MPVYLIDERILLPLCQPPEAPVVPWLRLPGSLPPIHAQVGLSRHLCGVQNSSCVTFIFNFKKTLLLGEKKFSEHDKIVKNHISFPKSGFLMEFMASGSFTSFSKSGPLHILFCFHSTIYNKGFNAGK